MARDPFDAALDTVLGDLFRDAGVPLRPPLTRAELAAIQAERAAAKARAKKRAAAERRWHLEARKRQRRAAALRAARRADAARGRR